MLTSSTNKCGAASGTHWVAAKGGAEPGDDVSWNDDLNLAALHTVGACTVRPQRYNASIV